MIIAIASGMTLSAVLALAIGGRLGSANLAAAIRAIHNVAREGKVAACRGLGVVSRSEVLLFHGRRLGVVHAACHGLGDRHIAVRFLLEVMLLLGQVLRRQKSCVVAARLQCRN